MSEVTEIKFSCGLDEQAERYEEMKKKTFEMAQKTGCTELDDRNLLSVSCKNVVGSRRAAWRMINSVAAQHEHVIETEGLKDDPLSLQKREIIVSYRKEIEKEIKDECQSVIDLIKDDIIPKCPPENFEHQTIGDYYRYLAECVELDERKEAADQSYEYYKKAYDIAKANLPCTNSVRLGLGLNFSVFYYEIRNDQVSACELAKSAFDDSIAELDTLSEDSYKDSTLIMQLLRDNLTLWTSDMDDEQNKDEKDDENE